MPALTEVAIRPLKRDDAVAIAAIDAAHTKVDKREFWDDVVARHLRASGKSRVGLVAVEGPREKVVGYLLAQVRAFEFGSEECGWIYAVGVHPQRLRSGIAGDLMKTALQRLRECGVQVVRTMVRRDDVAVLTFFRSRGFAAGPYVELEQRLDPEGDR